MIESLTPEQLKKLGDELKSIIDAGMGQKGSMESWLGKVEHFHRNGEPSKPSKGLPAVHYPILQERADALGAQICNVIGAQDPYMLAVKGASETDPDGGQDTQKDRLESAIHRLWQDAEFEHHIAEEAPIAIDSNACLVKLCPSGKSYDGNTREGISFHTIHPSDFVIYPATRYGIEQAEIVGERIFKLVREVESDMLSGTYYSTENVPTSDPDENDETGRFARAQTALGITPDSKGSASVELFDGIWLKDAEFEGEYKLYRVTAVMSTGFILDIEEYPYSIRWYFKRYLKPTSTQFWSETSVGRDLAPLNDAYNKLSSALYAGSMTTAKPPMIGPKLEEKYSTWEPGDYIESDDPAQPFTPNIRFDGAYIVQQLANIERQADMVARVNQNTMGVPTAQKQTATASSIQAAGVASGIEEFIRNFSRDMPKMASLTQEIVLGNFEAITDYYQGLITATEEDWKKRVTWEPNGKSPGNTPGAKLQAAQMLMEFAQDPNTGLDTYEIVRVMRSNSPLGNTDNIQKTKEQMLQEAMEDASIHSAMVNAGGDPTALLMGGGAAEGGAGQMLPTESIADPGPDFSSAGALPPSV